MTARPVLRAGKGMVRPLGAGEVFAEGAHCVRAGSNRTYGREAQTRVLTGLDRAARGLRAKRPSDPASGLLICFPRDVANSDPGLSLRRWQTAATLNSAVGQGKPPWPLSSSYFIAVKIDCHATTR